MSDVKGVMAVNYAAKQSRKEARELMVTQGVVEEKVEEVKKKVRKKK